MGASERLAWAADVVSPSPSDRILEVGCGHGVLISLMAERLTTGVVVGVDRSATMVAAAVRRNVSLIDVGRVRLAAATLPAAELGGVAFDVVVSFDVRAFWTPPAAEWDVVQRVLAPGGRVVVAFSLMNGGALAGIAESVRRLAEARGFLVVATHRAATSPIPSAALELRRPASATTSAEGSGPARRGPGPAA